MMRLRIKSLQDFWTGLAFIAFGATTATLSSAYPLGAASRMGPGYFPMLLGILLAKLTYLRLTHGIPPSTRASSRNRQIAGTDVRITQSRGHDVLHRDGLSEFDGHNHGSKDAT